jgi:hypothetical protein
MRTIGGSLLLAMLMTAACGGPTVDVTRALQLEIVNSGWYDIGIVNGQNKLVPAIVVRVKNNSDEKLPVLQLNALFRQVTAAEEWGSSFLTAAGSDGLTRGSIAGPLLLKSQNGYTGSGESRQEMLQNSHFVDAKVEVFAKYGSTQWKKIGEYPIERKLLDKQS